MSYTLIFDHIIYWIEINYFLSIFLFFIFIFIYSLFSIPGLIIIFVFGGYAFGIYLSYIVCIISFTLGCFCFFILSKYFFSKFFEKYCNKYTNKIDKYIKSSSIEYLIIFRLIPGTPLLVQNILLSLLEISSFKFILSTIIGSSPLMFFCIYIGSKLNTIVNLEKFSTKDVFSIDVILILLFIILIFSIRIIFKKK